MGARLREIDAAMDSQVRPAQEPLIAWGFDPIYFGAEPAAMFLVQRKIGTVGLLGPVDEAGMRDFAAIACMQGVTIATDMVNQ